MCTRSDLAGCPGVIDTRITVEEYFRENGISEVHSECILMYAGKLFFQ